ncbi:hypothetical protein B0H13DRAFT_2438310 [Mycena leptocephala]|nr:hypothetical protein B0H13DRAFT_2438310 [Mycena leptocephala]
MLRSSRPSYADSRFSSLLLLANPDNPAVDGQSIDPITQLWDLFSLGIPLCYIFDLLPEEDGFTKINHAQFNQEQYTANPDRAKKPSYKEVRAENPACETFTVTDLWGRNSTDGFSKYDLCRFAHVEDLLALRDNSPDNPKPALPTRTQENIIRELVETERKYGKDIELMLEKEFGEVYAPYYANYVSSSEFVFTDEVQQKLASLLKASWAADYQHFNALKQGSEASKRVADRVNEAARRAETEQTVKSLQTRVDDWKGHNVDTFGELLLYDFFVVNKSDVDREYHVFLFEKFYSCAKKFRRTLRTGRHFMPRNTPLLLKASPSLRRYALTVSWKKGDHDSERESFMLRSLGRSVEDMGVEDRRFNPTIRSGSQPNDPSGGLRVDTDEHRQTLATSSATAAALPRRYAISTRPLLATLFPAIASLECRPITTVRTPRPHSKSSRLRWPGGEDYAQDPPPRSTAGTNRCGLKYKDQDGDMVAVNSSEDVQIALEELQPGDQLTLPKLILEVLNASSDSAIHVKSDERTSSLWDLALQTTAEHLLRGRDESLVSGRGSPAAGYHLFGLAGSLPDLGVKQQDLWKKCEDKE